MEDSLTKSEWKMHTFFDIVISHLRFSLQICKDLFKRNVHCSIIWNSCGLERSQMFLSRGLVPMNQFIHAWSASLKSVEYVYRCSPWPICGGVQVKGEKGSKMLPRVFEKKSRDNPTYLYTNYMLLKFLKSYKEIVKSVCLRNETGCLG